MELTTVWIFSRWDKTIHRFVRNKNRYYSAYLKSKQLLKTKQLLEIW